MLGRFRERYENAMLPLGRAVGSLGVSPNTLSILAALLGVLASLSYARGMALLGALVLLGSTFSDMLDGAVARATRTTSRFGSVLDHVLDRHEPDRLAVSVVEGWRVELCHVALTDGAGRLAWYKIVDPSFHNWMGLALALRGEEISDFPLCNKSFNLSYCGHDL